MKVVFLSLLLAVSISIPISAQASCVVLLHGLLRTSDAMGTLEKALSKEGFFTVNESYPSRGYPIEDLADLAIKPALLKCPEGMPVNFVTHSLGGILARQYLSQHKVENLNRVVMLGPPNGGSEVVDKLGKFPGFHFVGGDAGLQLGTGKLSTPKLLGEANFDVGIIAGTRSVNLILSTMLPNADDGKVSVESTKLAGMNDHIEMKVTHPFMMNNDKVIVQVINYLENGSFVR